MAAIATEAASEAIGADIILLRPIRLEVWKLLSAISYQKEPESIALPRCQGALLERDASMTARKDEYTDTKRLPDSMS